MRTAVFWGIMGRGCSGDAGCLCSEVRVACSGAKSGVGLAVLSCSFGLCRYHMHHVLYPTIAATAGIKTFPVHSIDGTLR